MKFKLLKEDILKEYDADKIKIANSTSRSKGASAIAKDGTIRSVVAKYIMNNIDKNKSILDFGAGKGALQTQALRDNGFTNVTAYDFGDNIITGLHDPDALSKHYNIVFASNVLNVSSDEEMLRETLRDIWKVTKEKCIFNYPATPRKANLSTKEVYRIIKDELGIEPKVVAGTPSVPVWEVSK